ncbi:MAG: HAD-IA family hydrolase [Pseudomonadota bacterium]
MHAPPRLAIFDCDGTLVDSQANIVAAMAATFDRHDLPAPPPNDTRRAVGLSLPQVMARLAPQVDAEQQARMVDDYRQCFQAMRAERRLFEEPLFPGTLAALDRLSAAGWQFGIATGKSDRGLTHVLDIHGIADRFVTLQTADRHPSKPDPAMLHHALGEAGADAAAAVMIGDTVFDMAMAANAGVRAIGVAWGYHAPDELLAAGAEIVADDYAQLAEVLCT